MSGALADAFACLFAEPARAEAILRDALAAGDDPGARLMLAAARRLQGDAAGAFALADAVATAHPAWGAAHFERALALKALGDRERASAGLAEAERLGAPPGLHRERGDLLWEAGDHAGADAAYMRHVAATPLEPLPHQAFAAIQRDAHAEAARLLQLQLARYPGDVLALRHLAELHSAADRFDEAEALLRRLLERAPSYALARYGLAMVLMHDHRLPPALDQLERLLAHDPNRLEYLLAKAEVLGRLGDNASAAACLEQLLAIYPNEAAAWTALGHALRALGRRAACEAAYKRAIAVGDQVGEAYWGLANLKTYAFDAAAIADMRARAQRTRNSDDQVALLFALAKAHEDAGAIEPAFKTYAQANALRRARLPYDRAERTAADARARALYTRDFFAARQGFGAPDPDPIFIVGMPRSGSTLVEQILASHSAVEGTQELIELLAIARRLGQGACYPERLAELDAAACRALGEEYLARAHVFRRTGAPRFIDKMPNNFTQTGLIALILPNARIIDVRRHPLACGLSNFKQHWATGQAFAYDLADIGDYYRAYVELMAHFDEALPGRVHRVIYEDLVADPEREIRRLLDACGLPFEVGCLRFYENARAVRTPSSEQVRRPIYTEGLESWRAYEPWLGPLKEALGPVLAAYPAVPH